MINDEGSDESDEQKSAMLRSSLQSRWSKFVISQIPLSWYQPISLYVRLFRTDRVIPLTVRSFNNEKYLSRPKKVTTIEHIGEVAEDNLFHYYLRG